MAKSDTYTILFAAGICVGCSLLLSGTAAGLKKQQDLMVELDRRKNVLKAFQVAIVDEGGESISAEEVDRIFREHIREVLLDPRNGQPIENPTREQASREAVEKKDVLPLYVWRDGDEITQYAFPVSGKGLWSTIYGYLALERDLSTVLGVTFYKHGETPGLGGEISTDWFQAQFRGKKVFEDGRRLPLEIVKGKVADRYPDGSSHAVDGISGATLTGKGINRFVNEDLEMYEKYFRSIRKG